MPPPAFLAPLIRPDAPSITLTYAQSLDAKIAGRGRRQIRLSGEESMCMTHWLRAMHDGIMVGIGTAINDDPRLNVRLLPPSEHPHAPRPIILDPDLRLPPGARMIQALAEGTGARAPWILCRADGDGDPVWVGRRSALEQRGARVVPVPMVDGRMDLRTLPALLAALGINTLMVEGGADLIRQFLATPGLVDLLVVTVAPVFVPDGYGVEAAGTVEWEHCHTEVMGRDAVMVLRSKTSDAIQH